MRLGACQFTPEIPVHFRSQISIRHPAYIRGEDSMFSLPRLDTAAVQDETDEDLTGVDNACKTPDGTIHGVHHETVLLACQIIAGNAFDLAYLSYDQKGLHRVGISRDGVLTRSYYYLHVPQGTDNGTISYAVTPNFQEWRFPRSLPPSWQSLTPTEADHQPSCIISGSRTIDVAHVIPQAHDKWYTENAMFDYSVGARSVSESEENICRLRPDLHRVFDSRAFALVPKKDDHGQRQLVVHFFSIVKNFGDSALNIHNRRAHSLESVAPEFLFARFALTVFNCIMDFILRGEKRKIAITRRANDDTGYPSWVTTVVQMDRVQRNGLYRGGGSRNSSPTKRSRRTESQAGQDEELDLVALKQYAGDELSYPDFEEPRGRSRVRKWVLANVEGENCEERDRKRRCLSRSPPPLTTSPTFGTPSKHGSPDEHEHAGYQEHEFEKDTKNGSAQTNKQPEGSAINSIVQT